MVCPNCAGNGCWNCQQAATGTNGWRVLSEAEGPEMESLCSECSHVKRFCRCPSFGKAKPARLPREVKIGPRVYKVEIDATVAGEHAWGTCEHVNCTIRIGELAVARPGQAAVTFLHEIIHAVDNCWELDLTEENITRLANGLADALQQCGFYPTELKP